MKEGSRELIVRPCISISLNLNITVTRYSVHSTLQGIKETKKKGGEVPKPNDCLSIPN